LSKYQGFGGVGASGYGRYGGSIGFKNFSNRKGILLKRPAPQYVNKMMAPPFTDENIKKIRSSSPFMSSTTQN
jgi:hypothetical protein